MLVFLRVGGGPGVGRPPLTFVSYTSRGLLANFGREMSEQGRLKNKPVTGKFTRQPRDIPLPFREMPKHTPRHAILPWAGLFPPHIEPGLFHPVVIVHACLERRGNMASEGMVEVWIGRSIRYSLGVEAICMMIGRGNPLLAWPTERSLRRLHRILLVEWRLVNHSSL